MAEEATSSTPQSSTSAPALKRRKRAKEKNKDRISGLPDAVLCHILSFLPTKYAVGTSILSQRWRYLWTKVLNLDFDDGLLFDAEKTGKTLDSEMLFMNFVDRVLILRDVQSIQKFCLRIEGYYDSSHINAWICAAITRNVQALDLYISIIEGTVEMPRTIFTCAKLVTLKLAKKIAFNVPDSVILPSLKVLHLRSLKCLDDASIEKLVSGSPVLEELAIHRHYEDAVQTSSIYSCSLKILKHISNSVEDEDTNPYKVILDAPQLEFLELVATCACEEFYIQASSLIEAIIGVCNEYWEEEYAAYVDIVFQLLRQVSHVKVLCLNDVTMEILREAFGRGLRDSSDLPTFHNLTRLELMGSESVIVPDILSYAPNLEVLILEEWDAWEEPNCVPKCLLSSLAVIEFDQLYGSEEELSAMEYLLKNAMVLKKIIIKSHDICSGDDLKKLLTFEKASSSCQIAFY